MGSTPWFENETWSPPDPNQGQTILPFIPQGVDITGAVQPTAQLTRTRPTFTRSDYSNGRPRVSSSKTQRRRVSFEFPHSKPVKPDPPEDINSGEFSIDSDEFTA